MAENEGSFVCGHCMHFSRAIKDGKLSRAGAGPDGFPAVRCDKVGGDVESCTAACEHLELPGEVCPDGPEPVPTDQPFFAQEGPAATGGRGNIREARERMAYEWAEDDANEVGQGRAVVGHGVFGGRDYTVQLDRIERAVRSIQDHLNIPKEPLPARSPEELPRTRQKR